jgi:hypothetical protein
LLNYNASDTTLNDTRDIENGLRQGTGYHGVSLNGRSVSVASDLLSDNAADTGVSEAPRVSNDGLTDGSRCNLVVVDGDVRVGSSKLLRYDTASGCLDTATGGCERLTDRTDRNRIAGGLSGRIEGNSRVGESTREHHSEKRYKTETTITHFDLSLPRL